MKLFEIMLDKLSETALFEMAFSRKQAKDKVIDLSPQIFEHIIKVLVLDSPDDVPHWLGEIDGWIGSIQKILLKSNNRRIDKDTLYQWLVFDSAPIYDAGFVVSQYKFWNRYYPNVLRHAHDPKLIMDRILTIMKLVCADVEKDNFISIEDYI